jgi:hypothetical protein
MTQEFHKKLGYWRASLADGALGRGRFKHRDRKDFIELSSETLRDGKLPKNQIRKAFDGQRPDVEVI